MIIIFSKFCQTDIRLSENMSNHVISINFFPETVDTSKLSKMCLMEYKTNSEKLRRHRSYQDKHAKTYFPRNKLAKEILADQMISIFSLKALKI